MGVRIAVLTIVIALLLNKGKGGSTPNPDLIKVPCSSNMGAENCNKLANQALIDNYLLSLSKRHGVEVALINAVVKKESRWNHRSVSKSGAKGLMQLMPATAKELGVHDSFDPIQNLEGGVKYLGQLLSKYKGNKTLALAAYNAGMGNVAKYGGVPPFKETKDYVAQVLHYYKN